MSALPPKADIVRHDRDVRFVPQADILRRSKIVLLTRSAACGASKGSLDFRHPHLGFNRVGNETISWAAVGYLEKNADGKLAITRVELRPKIAQCGRAR
jgi:hypothetical protein